MEYILSAEGLRFMDIITYPRIQIEEQLFTFITGESGCGKSTLLRLLNNTLPASAGTIHYRGEDIRNLDPLQYRRRVLLAPQEVFLFDDTVRNNFTMYYDAREQKAPDDNAIEKALHICCADFPLNTACNVLSGGERQRVFLAICLSFMPETLLLDEPTSALDETTAKRLLTNIKSYCLRQRITPVAVCHSAELVKQYADRTLTLTKEAIS